MAEREDDEQQQCHGRLGNETADKEGCLWELVETVSNRTS